MHGAVAVSGWTRNVKALNATCKDQGADMIKDVAFACAELMALAFFLSTLFAIAIGVR